MAPDCILCIYFIQMTRKILLYCVAIIVVSTCFYVAGNLFEGNSNPGIQEYADNSRDITTVDSGIENHPLDTADMSGSQSEHLLSVPVPEQTYDNTEMDDSSGKPSNDGLVESLQKHDADVQASVQALIQSCMAKNGFFYEPISSGEPNENLSVVKEPGAQQENEAIKENNAVSGTLAPKSEANRNYYDSLSDSQKSAYDKALYGDIENRSLNKSYVIDYESDNVGCLDYAENEVSMGYDDYNDSQLELTYDLEAIEDDSRTKELYRKWSACMQKEYGLDFKTPGQLIDYIGKEFEIASNPSETSESNYESGLKAFRSRESEMANDDSECRQKTGFDDSMGEIMNDYVLGRHSNSEFDI